MKELFNLSIRTAHEIPIFWSTRLEGISTWIRSNAVAGDPK